MSQIVKCEICGKVYNQSYLGAHKRLAHGTRAEPPATVSELEAVEAILSVYAQLSGKGRKELRNRLSSQVRRKKKLTQPIN